jgi:hypothetical protein
VELQGTAYLALLPNGSVTGERNSLLAAAQALPGGCMRQRCNPRLVPSLRPALRGSAATQATWSVHPRRSAPGAAARLG